MNSDNTNSSSRRDFLKLTAAAVALPYFVPASALGANGKPPPSERIRLGLIGCGGMGRANLNNCAEYPDVVVTGACDPWKSRRDSVVAQFRETCRPYADYREMLQQPDLDAVIIATPPHWHALQAIAACEAGKDIYLQKPMTLHLGESLAVRNAVARHSIISQVGTQIHASDNYRRVVEFIRSGNLGRIGTVRTFNVMNQTPDGRRPCHRHPHARWPGLGPVVRPRRQAARSIPSSPPTPIITVRGWRIQRRVDPRHGAAHHRSADLGARVGISDHDQFGGRTLHTADDGDAYDHHEVLWQYPKLTMTWMSSLNQQLRFPHEIAAAERRLGIYFHGSNGTLYSNYGMFRVLAEGDRMKDKEAPPASIPSSPGHEREWLDCIKTRRQPSCSVSYHVRVDVPIVLSLLSLKLGRAIRFDPATERIVDDREAAHLAVPEVPSGRGSSRRNT